MVSTKPQGIKIIVDQSDYQDLLNKSKILCYFKFPLSNVHKGSSLD